MKPKHVKRLAVRMNRKALIRLPPFLYQRGLPRLGKGAGNP